MVSSIRKFTEPNLKMNIKFSLEKLREVSFMEPMVLAVTSEEFNALDPDLRKQIIHGLHKDRVYLRITTLFYSAETTSVAISGYFSNDRGEVVGECINFGGGLDPSAETGYIDIK